MDRSVTKNFRHRLPRYVCFACKTSRYIYIYVYTTLPRGSKNIALQETRRSFRIPWYGVTHPPLWIRKGGHAFVSPRGDGFPLVNSYSLHGYRSSGLPRRKDGFCERVTRGSPGWARLCLDLINFSYFRCFHFFVKYCICKSAWSF